MAYQTGVSTGIADLMTTLSAFAVANGFSAGPSWTYMVSTTAYTAGSLLKNGVYYTYSYTTTAGDDLNLNTATSISPGSNLTAQPGSATWSCLTNRLIGPHVGYHFFSDGNTISAAVELVTNVFTHFSFGEMIRNGSWVGGQFVTGFYQSSSQYNVVFSDYHDLPFDTSSALGTIQSGNTRAGHVRTPFGVSSILRNNNAALVPISFCTGWASDYGRPLILASPNNYNGRSVLVPTHFVQSSTGSTGPYFQLGTVANVRHINIKNLEPKSMVNTNWMVFPLCQKNGPGLSYLNSGDIGMAYRK